MQEQLTFMITVHVENILLSKAHAGLDFKKKEKTNTYMNTTWMTDNTVKEMLRNWCM